MTILLSPMMGSGIHYYAIQKAKYYYNFVHHHHTPLEMKRQNL